MSTTFFTGPVIALGAMTGGGDSKSAELGAGADYHGRAIIDPRYYPANKDGMAAGRIPGWLENPRIVVANNIPSTVSTTGIAAAAATVSGTAMTLTTVAPGGASGVPSLGTAVPYLPFGTSTPVKALALDFGFTTGSTTAASGTVTVPDSTLFTVGQWICISGAGNSAKTASLITQVQSLATATTITVSPVPTGTLNFCPVGSANLYGNFPSGATPNAAFPYVNGGPMALFNPAEGLARCISVTSGSAAAGGVIRVFGADIAGVSMSEDITAGAGTGTAYGQKAFKYITSIVPQFSDSGANHTYSVGWGDTFGYHLRSDQWEYTAAYWNGVLVPTNVGWLKGVATTPATRTTGDVRGTIQVGAAGAGTPITAASASDGAKRLVLIQTVPVYNLINSSPANLMPLLGVTQA